MNCWHESRKLQSMLLYATAERSADAKTAVPAFAVEISAKEKRGLDRLQDAVIKVRSLWTIVSFALSLTLIFVSACTVFAGGAPVPAALQSGRGAARRCARSLQGGGGIQCSSPSRVCSRFGSC